MFVEGTPRDPRFTQTGIDTVSTARNLPEATEDRDIPIKFSFVPYNSVEQVSIRFSSYHPVVLCV